MTTPLATSSTPVLTSPPLQQRPFSFAASASSSGLASRRRNNKNLSLCLSDSSGRLIPTVVTPRTLEFERPATPSNLGGPYQYGPARIMPQLFLGAEQNANDLDLCRQLSIQCMLNCAEEVIHPKESEFITFDHMLDLPMPSPSLSRASTASSTTSSLATALFDLTSAFSTTPTSSTRPKLPNHHYRTSSTSSNSQHRHYPMGYRKLPWKHNQDNLVTELDKAIAAIDIVRDAGYTILVHCQCGVARSATVVIAYVMKTLRMPMQEAYDYVKSRAPHISPNLGLLYQLSEYERKRLQSQPSTPTTPTKKLFQFRRTSITSTLSWKRRMAKTTSKVLSLGNNKEEMIVSPSELARC